MCTSDPLPFDAVQPTAQEPEQEQEQEQEPTICCDTCDTNIPEDEARYIAREPLYGTWGAAVVCEECCQECANCGGTMPHGEGTTVTGRWGRHMQWCPSCADQDSWCCEQCDERFDCGCAQPSVVGEEYLCESCAEDAEMQNGNVIGDYHNSARRCATSPMPSDWTAAHGGRYLGVELEMERRGSGGNIHELAAELLQSVNPTQGAPLLFAERDGSLRDGFELITQPMGLDAQRALWVRVLSLDTARHFRSHDTETCGLHVHVSRAGLSQLTIAKTVVFLNDPATEELIRAVARRYNTGYCHRKPCKLSRDAVRGSDRYEMLNTTGRHTVEFRIFRGSLRAETVLGCVEFAHAVLCWAAEASCAETTGAAAVPSFLRWVFAKTNGSDTANLRALLRRRAPHMVAAVATDCDQRHIAHTAQNVPHTTTTTSEEV